MTLFLEYFYYPLNLLLVIFEKFIDSIGTDAYKGSVHIGSDLQEVGVVFKEGLKLANHLGNLVRAGVQVSHHEVVLLRNDVALDSHRHRHSTGCNNV